MNERVRRRPTPWDALVVLACVAVGFLCLLWGASRAQTAGGMVVVCAAGEEILRMDAAQPGEETVRANGVTLVVQTAPQGTPGVRVCQADCPGNDCVQTGTITHGGEVIVCLPAKVTIRLEGASVTNVDAVTG